MSQNSQPLRARPTTYRGVRMRSRLEAFSASWFDSMGIAWEYEPDCFADETGQYLPDFRLTGLVVLGELRPVYVEVKPPGEVTRRTVGGMFRQMERIWSSAGTAGLLIFSADDEGFHFPPLRMPGPPSVTYRDAFWLRCPRCSRVGIDALWRMEVPYSDAEPWTCPSCGPGTGYDREVPWFSRLWYDLSAG